jgi:hypothetical protein
MRQNAIGSLSRTFVLHIPVSRLPRTEQPELHPHSLPPLRFFSLSDNAAALILATWIAANPPEVVMQSRPGIDIQVGHNRLMVLVRRNSGISSFDFGVGADYIFELARAVQH